jgi:hypothetical protein
VVSRQLIFCGILAVEMLAICRVVHPSRQVVLPQAKMQLILDLVKGENGNDLTRLYELRRPRG